MRVPLSWIAEFTPIDAPIDEIVACAQPARLEVEAVEEPGARYRGRRRGGPRGRAHPTPTSCAWWTCATARARSGWCAARPTSRPACWPRTPRRAPRCPAAFTLERRTIRGEVSDGMLCSARELGARRGPRGHPRPARHRGDDRGRRAPALGLDDVILDLSITPNRPDAMCVVVSPRAGRPLRPTADGSRSAVTVDPSVAAEISVSIEAPQALPR